MSTSTVSTTVRTGKPNQNQKSVAPTTQTQGPAPIQMPSFAETSTAHAGAFHYDQVLARATSGDLGAIHEIATYWSKRAATAKERLDRQNASDIPAIWKVKARLISVLCEKLASTSRNIALHGASSEAVWAPFVRHNILRQPCFEVFSTADLIDLLNGIPKTTSQNGEYISGMRSLSSFIKGYAVLGYDEDGWFIESIASSPVRILPREAHKLLAQGICHQNAPFNKNGVMFTTGAVPNCDGITLVVQDATIADTSKQVHKLGQLRLSMTDLAFKVLYRAPAIGLGNFTFASDHDRELHEAYSRATEEAFGEVTYLPKNAAQVDYWQATYMLSIAQDPGRLFDAGKMLFEYDPKELASFEQYQKARIRVIAKRRGARAVAQKAQPAPVQQQSNPAFRAPRLMPKVDPMVDIPSDYEEGEDFEEEFEI